MTSGIESSATQKARELKAYQQIDDHQSMMAKMYSLRTQAFPSMQNIKGQSFKRWCFTENNPIALLGESWTDKCEYMIYQLEKSPTTGTRHFQGYLVLKANPNNKNGRTLAYMKKTFSPTAHWEPANGSHDDNVHYCSKPHAGCNCKHCKGCLPRISGPYETGSWTDNAGPIAGGKKTASKLLAIKDAIKEGATDLELWDSHFSEMVRYHGAIERYALLVEAPRSQQTKVLWLWGPTSTGKSMRALKISQMHFPNTTYFANFHGGRDRQWFDGMKRDTELIIVNDFTAAKSPLTELLNMMDRYGYNVETKGGMINFKPKLMIFTSNDDPLEMYFKMDPTSPRTKEQSDKIDALKARLSGDRGTIIHMTTPYVHEDKEQDFSITAAELIAAAEAVSEDNDDDATQSLNVPQSFNTRRNAVDLTASEGDDDDDDVIDHTPEDAWEDPTKFPEYAQDDDYEYDASSYPRQEDLDRYELEEASALLAAASPDASAKRTYHSSRTSKLRFSFCSPRIIIFYYRSSPVRSF